VIPEAFLILIQWPIGFGKLKTAINISQITFNLGHSSAQALKVAVKPVKSGSKSVNPFMLQSVLTRRNFLHPDSRSISQSITLSAKAGAKASARAMGNPYMPLLHPTIRRAGP
jgi:hypothetical protein